MPALAKTALATAMALALAGGASAALSQPTTALHSHTGFVTMIAWEPDDSPDPQELSGTVPCQPTWHEKAWAWFSGRPACRYEGYAYAYPAGSPAPWNGTITWINDSTYTDRAGNPWHVAEIVYRVGQAAPGGGGTLVKAMASELMPDQPGQAGNSVNYALPVDEAHLGQGPSTLTIDLGPSPNDVAGTL